MSAAEEILLPKKKKANVLKKCYDIDPNVYEIGVDEVGRGPLFGRVYTAAVILPKDDSFDCSMVKDSKKFTSKKKIAEAAQYIKDHALAYHISYEDEKTIDSINILQATQLSMHNSIKELIKKFNTSLSYLLLVDGNYFKPVAFLNKTTNKLVSVPHVTITGGDAIYWPK